MSKDRLLAAVAALLTEGQGKGGQRIESARLSQAYREGLSSSAVDTSAYLATRLPATHAAVSRVLAEVKALRPDFRPGTMVDAGAGPGTGSWAAASCWESIAGFTLVDRDGRFLALAGKLLAASDRPGLAAARLLGGDIAEIAVRAAMSGRLFTCRAEDTVAEAERTMSLHQVRRLPVVDARGALVGLIALDDIAREACREEDLLAPPVSCAAVGRTLGQLARPQTVRTPGAEVAGLEWLTQPLPGLRDSVIALQLQKAGATAETCAAIGQRIEVTHFAAREFQR